MYPINTALNKNKWLEHDGNWCFLWLSERIMVEFIDCDNASISKTSGKDAYNFHMWTVSSGVERDLPG